MEKRDILFCGKRVDGKGWIYGDLHHVDGKVFIFNQDQNDSADNYKVILETVGIIGNIHDLERLKKAGEDGKKAGEYLKKLMTDEYTVIPDKTDLLE